MSTIKSVVLIVPGLVEGTPTSRLYIGLSELIPIPEAPIVGFGSPSSLDEVPTVNGDTFRYKRSVLKARSIPFLNRFSDNKGPLILPRAITDGSGIAILLN